MKRLLSPSGDVPSDQRVCLWPAGAGSRRRSLGINITHFGLMMCFNVRLAAITPPFGTYIFMVSGLLKMKTADMIREIWPFIAVAIAVLLLVTYVPQVSTFIPNLFYGGG